MRSNPYIWKQPVYHRIRAEGAALIFVTCVCFYLILYLGGKGKEEIL